MTSNKETFGSGSLRGVASFRAGLVDHRLERRHLINEYHRGRLGREEVCDAHPELMRAARGIGKRIQTKCPICDVSELSLATIETGTAKVSGGKREAKSNVKAALISNKTPTARKARNKYCITTTNPPPL